MPAMSGVRGTMVASDPQHVDGADGIQHLLDSLPFHLDPKFHDLLRYKIAVPAEKLHRFEWVRIKRAQDPHAFAISTEAWKLWQADWDDPSTDRQRFYEAAELLKKILAFRKFQAAEKKKKEAQAALAVQDGVQEAQNSETSIVAAPALKLQVPVENVTGNLQQALAFFACGQAFRF